MGINPLGLSRDLMESLPAPAPDFRWRVIMPPVPGIASSLPGGQMLVEAVSWPFITIDPVARFGGGTNRHYPGWNNLAGFAITLYETATYDATSYLQAWLGLVVHTDGSYGLPATYKLPIQLFKYGWQNDTTPVWQDEIPDCWPSQQNAFDLNYTNEGRLVVGAQFNCDSKSTSGSGFSGATNVAAQTTSISTAGTGLSLADAAIPPNGISPVE
jgi:hypothetical protein